MEKPFDDIPHSKGEALDRHLAHVARLTPWALPIWRAARDGNLVIVPVPRDTELPADFGKRLLCPLLIIIGDDDHASTGPSRFPCAEHILRRADFVFLYAAAGSKEYYETFATKAKGVCRSVLIEADSAHSGKWLDLINRCAKRGQFIWFVEPLPGRVHPAPECRPREH
jgi:hypothetical protein